MLVLVDGKVMMEYIGATGVPIAFDDIPIKDGIDFHFILSFAIDADASGAPQNGVFSPYWAETLTPEAVAAAKSRHPNVKAMASLSGWSLGTKTLSWYNPRNKDTWISNAFSSLKTLIQTYNLDGIDVDYERFPRRSNDTFAYCIGELITMLKDQGVITVATIAPFYTTVPPYLELFSMYGGVIDYVNYQFYTDKLRGPRKYVAAFENRTRLFDANKVLPSYEVNGRGIQGEAFFEALGLLEEKGFEINGAMIFSADASASGGFYYENRTQEFLLGNAARGV